MPDPISGIPSQFEAGDTVIFTENFTDYDVATYSASLVLNNAAAAPTTVAATVSGTNFLFTISAAVSATYAPGQYTFAVYCTASATRFTAKSGVINILPNLTATATPSFAQAQVTLLKTVLAEFNATTRQSVNFNGQSFSRASINEYQKQLTYYRAEVIRETAAANAARGVTTGNRIAIQFVPSSDNNPVSIAQ